MIHQGFDVAVIGGGIIGLATALELTERFPHVRLTILEKEDVVAMHQTGHNSGVIHTGLYYRPGSTKAKLCVEGARLLREFLLSEGIPFQVVGKVIVAAEEAEIPLLGDLLQRGVQNGVADLSLIGPERLREIEPHVHGLCALHSPQTGIVDYTAVARAMAIRLRLRGGEILTGAKVLAVVSPERSPVIETTRGEIPCQHMINCGGLYADSVARMMGFHPDVRIIPFRGEYYILRAEKKGMVRGLIYPVPDPAFPFLGVHFTRTIHGEVEAGPNAVLAFAREGYRVSRVHLGEMLQIVSYRGFWAMARRYWKTGIKEFHRSLSKRAFLSALQHLVPSLEERDLQKGGSGVRAQAVSPDGALVDDFKIVSGPRSIHVLNAPSPAATASLAIGRHIASLAARVFTLGG